MKVYVLMISTYSNNAYCDWEWQCEGLYASEELAEEAGVRYKNSHPDEMYSVEDHIVKGL